MTDGQWKLPEEKVKRIEELQKEIAELEKPDDGEMNDLPLKNVTGQVLDVEAEEVPANDLLLFKDMLANVFDDMAAGMRDKGMLVAVYRRTDDRLIVRTHRHFIAPEDFENACDLLRRDLLGEQSPNTIKPLPRATVKRPKPTEVLFGKDKDGE